jgi:hypothetical protein
MSELDEFLSHLLNVLHTEPGWEQPLTQERLHELIIMTLDEINETA